MRDLPARIQTDKTNAAVFLEFFGRVFEYAAGQSRCHDMDAALEILAKPVATQTSMATLTWSPIT